MITKCYLCAADATTVREYVPTPTMRALLGVSADYHLAYGVCAACASLDDLGARIKALVFEEYVRPIGGVQ